MKAADKTLSKRYARAYMCLDGLAFESKTDAAAKGRIAELKAVWSDAARFKRFFLHPLIGYEDKREILVKLLPKELMTSHAAEFVRLLIKENRVNLLDTVLEDCVKLYNAYAGIVLAEVASRYPLTTEEAAHVEKTVSAAFGKKVLVTQAVTERVIGGLEIKISDLLIDATIKGRLEKLRKSILTF